MAIVKVVEVIASSEISIDEAVKSAVAEASKTIHNIDSVYVKDIKAHVKDGKVSTFGCVCKISFRVMRFRLSTLSLSILQSDLGDVLSKS